MKNIETRLDSIERTIDKGNLFILLGIFCFTATKAKSDDEKKLIEVGAVLTFVAVIMNTIGGLISKFDED